MRIHPLYADASDDRANDCSPVTTYAEHLRAIHACTPALAWKLGWLQPAQGHGWMTGWSCKHGSPQVGKGPEKVAEWRR